MGVWSTTSANIVLVTLIRSIGKTRSRSRHSRWRSRGWSVVRRQKGVRTPTKRWKRSVDGWVSGRMERRCTLLTLVGLLRLFLDLACFGNVWAILGCVRSGVADSAWDCEIGDNRGLVLWRISGIGDLKL
jgi:hypothetical protein